MTGFYMMTALAFNELMRRFARSIPEAYSGHCQNERSRRRRRRRRSVLRKQLTVEAVLYFR